MKIRKHIFLLALLSLYVSSACFADVKLPAIVSSKMVLQRNTTITFWGWAPGPSLIPTSYHLHPSERMIGMRPPNLKNKAMGILLESIPQAILFFVACSISISGKNSLK